MRHHGTCEIFLVSLAAAAAGCGSPVVSSPPMADVCILTEASSQGPEHPVQVIARLSAELRACQERIKTMETALAASQTATQQAQQTADERQAALLAWQQKWETANQKIAQYQKRSQEQEEERVLLNIDKVKLEQQVLELKIDLLKQQGLAKPE